MIKERIARIVGALLMVAVGLEGLFSPLAYLALRSMPDCIDAGPMAAWAGVGLHLLSANPLCPYGSYAPAPTYHVVAQAALTASLTALLLGVLWLLLSVGVGLRAKRALSQLRRWFAHRFRVVASATSSIVFQLGQPVMLPVVVRPVRMASRPHVRRGPPSCSC